MSSARRDRFIYRTTLGYAALAALWIFASDRLLAVFADINQIVWLSTAKGLTFVVVTTALLFIGLKTVPPKVDTAAAQESVQNSSSREKQFLRNKKAALYAFAIVASLTVLWVRLQLGELYGSQLLLIVFMLPIILSALLGGLGPGIVATLTCAIGIDYWGIPPVGSLKIGNPLDMFQWVLLIFNGVLISVLSEGLRHAMQRSERHQQELLLTTERLRQSEHRLRLALDAAHAGTWEWQPGNTHHYWSDELLELFGFPPESVKPSLSGWLKTVHPDDRDVVSARLQTPVKPGDTYEMEWRVNTPPNVPARWMLSRGQHVPSRDGQRERYVGIIIDISVRKRAEAEISRLNADLEQRVLERTAELTAANRELDAFAYAVSHDLRAPLRAMSGMSRIVIEDYANLLPEAGRRHLAEIDTASRKMSELIDALLTLSRSTRGDLIFDTVDVTAIARRLATDLAQHEPLRTVSVQIEPGLTVRGDARLIEVVMGNLLTNAWKYTANTVAPTIRVYAEQHNGQRCICVSDNGAGFKMEHANKLFQPFQRLHRQDEFPGTGIGLATVQRIVHRHGGTIDAHAKPGEGATFRFSLPEAVASQKIA